MGRRSRKQRTPRLGVGAVWVDGRSETETGHPIAAVQTGQEAWWRVALVMAGLGFHTEV